MWTCIIPTLWKSERIKVLFFDLIECEQVGEIIVIDNAPNKDIDHLPKVVHIKNKENIFVNPAWNLGISIATYENIAIINDDVNFDTSIFAILEPQIKDVGVCGMMYENYSKKKTEAIKIFPLVERPYGWGCLIFLHKSNYVEIPNELKIACGDDYLIKFAPKATKLLGLQIESDISTTTQLPEFGEQQIKDNELWRTMNNNNSAKV
jgi:hypothetical protein